MSCRNFPKMVSVTNTADTTDHHSRLWGKKNLEPQKKGQENNNNNMLLPVFHRID